jgi:hypothetical protein
LNQPSILTLIRQFAYHHDEKDAPLKSVETGQSRKTNKWTFAFVSSLSSRYPQMTLSKGTIGFLSLIVLMGFAGFARLSAFVFSVVSHKIEHRQVRSENVKIQRHLMFLEKQTQGYRKKFKELSDYEKSLRRKYGIREVPDDARLAGVGGAPSIEDRLLFACPNSSLRPAFMLSADISTLMRQVSLEDTLLGEAGKCIADAHTGWRQTPSLRPTCGRLTSPFGWRADPMEGETLRFHEGIDFANKTGTPVLAPADGVVCFTGWQGTYGKAVHISHEVPSYETVYGHLDSYVVCKNQKVQRGDLIGYMGNTGRSTGPHLHYEIRKSGSARNPEEYLLPDSILTD